MVRLKIFKKKNILLLSAFSQTLYISLMQMNTERSGTNKVIRPVQGTDSSYLVMTVSLWSDALWSYTVIKLVL